MRIFASVVLCLVLFVFAVIFFGSLFIFRVAAKREKRVLSADDTFIEKYRLSSKKAEIKANIGKWNSLHHEEVLVTSFDGTQLRGVYAPAENACGTVILFHGWRSSSERDFSCILGIYIEKKFNILLVDERAHGKSGGKYITFGINESRDAICWIDFINSRENGAYPVFLEGLSMGATTVMMACGRGLPSSVKGVIADCGFTSPKEIILHVIKGYRLPAKLIFPFVSFWFRVLAKTDPNYSTLDALENCNVPLLIIHGEDDKFVPCDMSRRNFEVCRSEKTLLTVPGAGHGASYIVDSEKCLAAIDTFYSRFGL